MTSLINKIGWLNTYPGFGSAFNANQQYDELQISKDVLRSVDIFLRELKKIVGTKPVLLVFDGDRGSIYAGKRDRDISQLGNQGMNYMKEQSQKILNLSILDMHPIFEKEWNENRKSLNYEHDFHWNELGHAIVANSIIETDF